MHCRRGGVRRIGAPFRRSRGTFRRCGAGRGARFRSGERRAAQGFAPARRSGRPKGTRGRFDANRRAIRRGTIGFHGVVLFFSVNELGSGRALSGATPPKGCFSGCPSVEGGPPFVGTWGEREPLRGNPFARAPCREAFAEGRVPARANLFARAPCREAFAVGSVLARGKSFRPSAVSGGLRRGERFCAGQTLSPVRRVGKPSPRRAFSRGGKS